jgi:hypothetical protein
MFSKSKINEPGPKAAEADTSAKAADVNQPKTSTDFAPTAPKAKPRIPKACAPTRCWNGSTS